jgi:hypothetical protein
MKITCSIPSTNCRVWGCSVVGGITMGIGVVGGIGRTVGGGGMTGVRSNTIPLTFLILLELQFANYFF